MTLVEFLSLCIKIKCTLLCLGLPSCERNLIRINPLRIVLLDIKFNATQNLMRILVVNVLRLNLYVRQDSNAEPLTANQAAIPDRFNRRKCSCVCCAILSNLY
jgi:hypothetical protein